MRGGRQSEGSTEGRKRIWHTFRDLERGAHAERQIRDEAQSVADAAHRTVPPERRAVRDFQEGGAWEGIRAVHDEGAIGDDDAARHLRRAAETLSVVVERPIRVVALRPPDKRELLVVVGIADRVRRGAHRQTRSRALASVHLMSLQMPPVLRRRAGAAARIVQPVDRLVEVVKVVVATPTFTVAEGADRVRAPGIRAVGNLVLVFGMEVGEAVLRRIPVDGTIFTIVRGIAHVHACGGHPLSEVDCLAGRMQQQQAILGIQVNRRIHCKRTARDAQSQTLSGNRTRQRHAAHHRVDIGLVLCVMGGGVVLNIDRIGIRTRSGDSQLSIGSCTI